GFARRPRSRAARYSAARHRPIRSAMGAHPAVLLVHDGGVSHLRRGPMGLGVEVHERVGPPTPAECARSWDLVIGTPGRLIELDAAPGTAACRIAALSADTRTQRAIVAR